MEQVKLNNGLLMPIVGLGTWRAAPEEIETAVNEALAAGYRHIDTAFAYGNEEAIGNVLKKWFDEKDLKRKDLFITTKLPVFGNRAQDVEKFLKMSLEKLQMDYVDLYLIHMPFALQCDETCLQPVKNEDGTVAVDFTNDNFETWKKMEEQVKAGRTKTLGLSNFNVHQVRQIYEKAELVKPSVLQVELHAYLQQKELVKVCKELNIAVTAYAPLGSPGADQHFLTKYNYKLEKFPDLLQDSTVAKVAEKYKKTAGQMLLRHLIQNGIIVIPKSKNPDRIRQNVDVFDFTISGEDMDEMNALDKGEAGRIFSFLFFKNVDKHQHYPFALKK